ncbi:MAG: FAD-dependent oxidoreductase [Dongiaceae bacterium]
MTIPARADVVIIGGGIIGCSLAYHLTKIGIKDVLLLERKKLSCGTTWHSVGSVGQLRGTRIATELALYSSNLFKTLEAETEQPTGFKQYGSIMLALNKDRLTEMKRTVSMAKSFGLDAEMITVADVKARCGYVTTDDALAGMWMAGDGRVNATDTTLALAKGARMGGARIIEDVKVDGLVIENGAVKGVVTGEGTVRANAVALCAGLWSRDFAARYGVSLPMHAAEHFYAVTEPVKDLKPGMPLIRVPDESTYYKDDAGKLLFGCLERKAKPWGMDGIPEDFAFDALPEDLDQFEPILTKALDRFPLLRDAGIRLFFNGPETFTPDGNALLGETPELKNFFVACGMNTTGVMSAGGVGKILSEWIKTREVPEGFVDADIRRAHSFQAGKTFLYDRTVEALGVLYDMGWPNREYASARGARRSPLHDTMLAAGAVMGQGAGWESPLVFAPEGAAREIGYSFAKQNWFDWCAAECKAATDAVAGFDVSAQGKILVEGPAALALLRRVSATAVDGPVGKPAGAIWLNRRGRIVSLPTILRLGEDRFLVLTAAASQRRDLKWLQDHVAGGETVAVADMTGGWALIELVGPKADALVAVAAGREEAPAAEGGSARLGYAPVVAWREQCFSLPAWGILASAEFGASLGETLAEAGTPLGFRWAGSYAAHSLRLDAAEAAWPHEIDDTVTPTEAGMASRLRNDTDFLGASAPRPNSARKLVQLRLADGERWMFRQEPIVADGVVVGITTGGAFGHRMGKPVALGWVQGNGFSERTRWEIEIAGERAAATGRLLS